LQANGPEGSLSPALFNHFHKKNGLVLMHQALVQSLS
jgi:hypothetical protein